MEVEKEFRLLGYYLSPWSSFWSANKLQIGGVRVVKWKWASEPKNAFMFIPEKGCTRNSRRGISKR